jgi:molybdenum cofactor synthesis domain-containing protein
MGEKLQQKTACVIIIGNEILSGRTQDLNISYIGKRCDQLGIRLAECRVVPDTTAAIRTAVNTCRRSYDYVFTTGGIGPTHDDITAAAVAAAFRRKVERNMDAVNRLRAYYGEDQLTEARLKMAQVPTGARLIDNPVSGAPGFQIDNVFVLPGVPLIMQAMFEGMTDRLTGGDPVLTGSVVTGLPESAIADGLGKVQDRFPDVSIGSYPFFRKGKLGVNIVLRTTDTGRLAGATAAVDALIREMETRA